MNNFKKQLMSCLCATLIALGLTGNAVANNGCLSGNATFTSSIGSTTSCADHGMSGCVVGSGGTGCTYTGNTCDFEVVVNPPVGASQDKSTSYSVINMGFNPTCQVKASITQGNQGASFCVNIYPVGVSADSLTTLGNKGAPVSHKQLEVCTDEVVAVGGPVVRIEKTVVRVLDDGTYNCSDAADEIDVIAPVEVAFCYTISNAGLGTIDDLVVVDDNGTPADTSDDFTVPATGSLGSLPSGGTLVADSGPVMLENSGERVNTATVSGTFQGSSCEYCTDSDTATTNVVVACDDQTQQQADLTGQVVESRDAAGTTRCAPSQNNTGVDSVGLLCDGNCDLRPECVNDPAACVQPCQPSGNWTYLEDGRGLSFGQCMFAEPSTGKLPLCQEVLGNPSNDPDCNVIDNPSLLRSDGHSSAFSSNPTLYYFPSSGGGNSIGTIYCILHPGETASVCPAGSWVF